MKSQKINLNNITKKINNFIKNIKTLNFFNIKIKLKLKFESVKLIIICIIFKDVGDSNLKNGICKSINQMFRYYTINYTLNFVEEMSKIFKIKIL